MATPQVSAASRQKSLLNFFSKGNSVKKDTNMTPAQSQPSPAQRVIIVNETTPEQSNGMLNNKEKHTGNETPMKLQTTDNTISPTTCIVETPSAPNSSDTSPLQSSDFLYFLPSPETDDCKDAPQLADLMTGLSNEDKETANETSQDIQKEDIESEKDIKENATYNDGTEKKQINSKVSGRRPQRQRKTAVFNLEDAYESPRPTNKKTSKATAAFVAEAVISPELQKRVDLHNSRMQEFANELVALESTSGYCDNGLAMDEAIKDLLSLCEMTVASDDEAFLARCVQSVRTLIARQVHGSPSPLSSLVKQVSKVLDEAAITLQISDTVQKEVDPSLNEGEGPSGSRPVLVAMLNGLQDEVVLAEEIKLIAVRTSFGATIKALNSFEDTNVFALYRWEVVTSSYFPDSLQPLLREVKATRGRYGRLIAAVWKLVEALKKPHSPKERAEERESKIVELESRVSKANLELEKAKDRKAELDRKREEERLRREEDKAKKEEEKNRKEAEKEAQRLQRLKEKEEAQEKKRLEAEKKQAEMEERLREKAKDKDLTLSKTKTTGISNEKEQKIAMEREKQKSFFMNFLSKANTTTAAPSQANSQSSVSSSQENVELACSPSSSFNTDAFDASIRHSCSDEAMPLSSIINYYKQRYQDECYINKSKLTKRKAVTLYVSVAPSNGNFDYVEGYAETKVVKVDNRIKTLKFFHDERPPYVGTFSKWSAVISGRKPLSKDDNLFNYDYDSEAEWEAEEEGEDIENSDGGDEELDGGDQVVDDLEYDEFFLKDNDFGSDADSDGEDMAATLIHGRRQQGYTYSVEIFGPRFIDKQHSSDGLPSLIAADRDEAHLRSFSTHVMAVKSAFPELGLQVESAAAPDAVPGADAATINGSSAAVSAGSSKVVDNLTNAALGSENPGNKSKSAVGNRSEAPAKKSESKFAWTNDMMKDLIMLIHGKKDGVDKLVNSFHETHTNIPKLSKTEIKKKILDISCKQKHVEGYGSYRLVVNGDVLSFYSVEIDPLAFTPKKKRKADKLVIAKVENALASREVLVERIEAQHQSEPKAMEVVKASPVKRKFGILDSFLRPSRTTTDAEIKKDAQNTTETSVQNHDSIEVEKNDSKEEAVSSCRMDIEASD